MKKCIRAIEWILGQIRTLEIDMSGPVTVDVWDGSLTSAVKAGVVVGADACGGGVQVQERRGEWWGGVVIMPRLVLVSAQSLLLVGGLALRDFVVGVGIVDQGHIWQQYRL